MKNKKRKVLLELCDIHESVDLLGFWFEIEKYGKNNHRHIIDISESRPSLTGGLFFSHSEDIGPDSVDFERQSINGLIHQGVAGS